MLTPKQYSYKEFDDEKKFLLLENSPPSAPVTFLMVRPQVQLKFKLDLLVIGIYFELLFKLW